MDKKIVFITNRLIGGGSERVLVTIANSFAKLGYEVSILSYLNSERYPISEKVRVFTLENEKSKLQRIIKVRKLICQIKPDTVIAFEYFVNMQVILACLGLNVRVIVSERNDPARKGGEFPNRLFRNILYHFCDVLVCQTPDAKRYFPKGVQKHAIIIPNPLKEGLPEPWTGERAHEVVNFCRLEKQKNLPLLIDSFELFHRKHPDYTLKIYGDGAERENLIKYIKDKKLQDFVILHPAVPDIHERILKSAMFVSSSDYEGLSNSMLEAMAIGLPTICTDCPCGGARMMINHEENGWLVDLKSIQKLCEAMCHVANMPEFAREISYNSIKMREILSVEKIVELWEKLL